MLTLAGNIKFNNVDVYTTLRTEFLSDTCIRTIDCLYDNKSLELILEYDFHGNFRRGQANKYINNILANESIWYDNKIEQIGFFETLDSFWLSFAKHVFKVDIPAY